MSSSLSKCILVFVCVSLVTACEVEDPRVKNTPQNSSSQPSSRSQSGPVVSGSSEQLAALEKANARAEMLLNKLNAATEEIKRLKQQKNAEQPAKTVAFDHSSLDQLLRKYVKNGLVDYKKWKAESLPKLDSYLNNVRNFDPETLPNQSHKMAFWINVYNAWTLRSMLDLYPTDSILKHAKGQEKEYKGGIWKSNPIKINGKDYSLDAIEHQILRKMGDPRIHFGIVCASIGCPPLASEAYVPEKLSAQLQKNGEVFFSDSTKFQVDFPQNTVKLSKIFEWFGKDFAASGDAGDLQKALSQFVTSEKQKKVMQSGNAKVAYLDYNWNINAQN